MQRQRLHAGPMLLAGLLAVSFAGACAGPERRTNTMTTEPIIVFSLPTESEAANVLFPNLRRELLDMAAEDQAARTGAPSPGGDPDGSPQSMMHVDRENTARMHEIVDEVGWPTKRMVGADGTRAAWLLVQHADHDVAFQRRCLGLMQALQKEQEVYRIDAAYLTDRVLVNEGKPQIYGTQFHTVGGELQPRPIQNPEQVEARRKELGLPTLAEYREQVRL